MRVGIDIVDIGRLKAVVERTPHFLERIYSQQELNYCFGKHNPYPSLAARFACKEAFRKLDISFTRGVRFHDVEVVVAAGGRPELVIHAEALDRVKKLGIISWDLSLAHSQEQAIATVIANRG